MEVVGAAASIATLIEVCKVAVEIQHRLRGAPAEIEKSLQHVQFIAVQLRALMELQRNMTADDAIERTCAVMLTHCYQDIAAINEILALTSKFKRGKRLRWALIGRARTKELMTELACVHSSLNVVLNVLQCRHLDVLRVTVSSFVPEIIVPEAVAKRPAPALNRQKRYPSPIAKTYNTSINHVSTEFRQSKLGRSGLVTLTATLTYLGHTDHHTAAILLRLILMSKYGVQIELSGWLALLRVDRLIFTLQHVVPDDHLFMMACREGDVVRVREYLRTCPSSVNYTDTSARTPLSYAIEAGHMTLCAALIDAGAKVDSIFGHKHTSTMAFAIRHKHLELARLLLQKGAPLEHVNAYGWSSLFYLWAETSRQGDVSDFIKFLGCQATFEWHHRGMVDIWGWSLLARCATFGRPDDAALLVSYGVDPLERAPDSQWTILHYVINYGVLDSFERLLPEYHKRSDLELPDFAGWTLLHLAVENGDSAIIRRLLEYGADWEAKTLPSCNETVPQSLRGIPASTVDIAAACGDQRYVDYLDILDELGLLVGGTEVEGDWYDAVARQT